MVQEVRETIFRHGLTFYGTLAFLAGFLGARLFATLNPTVVVVRGGIHFHHFWYGLGMVVGSGWAGIATNDARLSRILAIVFGLGTGLIGDEVGLLLTFGNYDSNLTEVFFVVAIGFITLVTLFSRARSTIEREVLDVNFKERLRQIGVFVCAFSVVSFAAGNWVVGLGILGLGVLGFLIGFERARRMSSRSLFP